MKILIVGAGAAGITAGHALSEKGIDFEILEASSVHGGRVKKDADFADFPIDLGAVQGPRGGLGNLWISGI
jgi:protoporphyrinogen oxidase